MKYIVKYTLAIVLVSSFIIQLQAQDVYRHAHIKLYFQQGISQIDKEIKNNADSITKFIRMMDEVRQDTAFALIAARINSSCSPEASYLYNKRLSEKRTGALYNYLRPYMPTDSFPLLQNSAGIGWAQLHELMKNSTYANRDTVMSIIENIDELEVRNGKTIEKRKQILEQVNGGKTYKELYQTYFPLMRSASLELVYHKKWQRLTTDIAISPLNIAMRNYEFPSPQLSYQPVNYTFKEESIDPRFAIKTNLLYWVGLAPNIELEYAFAKHWSVSIDYAFAWWKRKPEHKYYRFLLGSGEVKYWIANKQRLKGHYVSLFLADGKYEFMKGGEEKGYQGELNWVPGISYGYSMPISKRAKNLFLELSLGAGLTKTEYREYHYNEGCYVYDYTKRRIIVLPLKTKVSLSWHFGYKKK